MAKRATSADLKTPEFRLAFPSVFEMREYQGRSSYQITMLFPKEENINELRQAAKNVAVEAFGSDPNVLSKLRVPFQDGDAKPEVDGFPGHVFVRAKSYTSDNPPAALGPDGEPLMDQRELYGGCYCRALIQFYAYDVSGNRGVSTTFSAIQVLRPGERFGKDNVAMAQAHFDAVREAEDNPANYQGAESTAASQVNDPFGA